MTKRFSTPADLILWNEKTNGKKHSSPYHRSGNLLVRWEEMSSVGPRAATDDRCGEHVNIIAPKSWHLVGRCNKFQRRVCSHAYRTQQGLPSGPYFIQNHSEHTPLRGTNSPIEIDTLQFHDVWYFPYVGINSADIFPKHTHHRENKSQQQKHT